MYVFIMHVYHSFGTLLRHLISLWHFGSFKQYLMQSWHFSVGLVKLHNLFSVFPLAVHFHVTNVDIHWEELLRYCFKAFCNNSFLLSQSASSNFNNKMVFHEWLVNHNALDDKHREKTIWHMHCCFQADLLLYKCLRGLWLVQRTCHFSVHSCLQKTSLNWFQCGHMNNYQWNTMVDLTTVAILKTGNSPFHRALRFTVEKSSSAWWPTAGI